ncbi:MAG TPA: arsenic resistance protein [Nitrososphaeraceae archaeon]|nr:arsenic resistance protein [Nitrososphaeraceae archaeon]
MRNNGKSQSPSSSQSDKDDSILLIVIAFSMTVGILLPSFGIIFEPFLLVWLGFLLFLNLLKMDPHQLTFIIKKPLSIIIFTIIKLIALPIILFTITNIIYPSLALSVLLLSGISTGLGAPFVINVFEKRNRLPFVVGMIILTSIVVPFILPSLVFLLVDISKFEIPVGNMVILLAEALFLPLFAGWFTKRKAPKLAKKLEEKSYILSIIFISFINFGIFAKYSSYFSSQYSFVITMTIAAFTLYIIYGLIGYLSAFFLEKEDKSFRIAAFVIMSYVNNILVVVFASKFFGSEIAALAAFYNISYYSMIIPMKKIFLLQLHLLDRPGRRKMYGSK